MLDKGNICVISIKYIYDIDSYRPIHYVFGSDFFGEMVFNPYESGAQ